MRSEQSAFEKSLHVATTISDNQDNDTRFTYAVYQTKLPEQDLAKFLEAQGLNLVLSVQCEPLSTEQSLVMMMAV